MRRFMWFSVLLSALTVATSVSAQDKLTLNQTYREAVRLNFSVGLTQIPLPMGQWVLAGMENDTTSLGTPMMRGYLARTNSGSLTGLIWFSINTEFSSGTWPQSSFCEKENLIFMKKIRNYSEDVDCWALDHRTMTAKSNRKAVMQLFDYLKRLKIEMPITMVAVKYRKTDNSKQVSLNYYFNPEVEGFSPPKQASWRANDWHRDRIYLDPEKVAYVDRLKLWGREWKRNVDAGFEGELEKSKIAQPSVSPGTLIDIAPAAGGETTPATGGEGDIEARLTRLKKLFDGGLITDSEYNEKRREILKGL